MRLRHRLRSDAPGLSGTDANDRFMRSHCALWASRVLHRYPRLDRETLEFVMWILDPATDSMRDILAKAIPQRAGIDVDEILVECGSAPDEQALAIISTVGRLGSSVRSHVVRSIVNGLESIVRTGADSSPCPLAHSLEGVAATYGLTDDDLDVGFFLGSMSSWSVIERYFDSHLEYDRPAGRKYLLAALGMSHAQMRGVLQGKLSRIGILQVAQTWLSLDSEFAPLFSDPSEAAMLRGLHRAVPKPDLAIEHLGIEATDLDILKRLLTVEGDTSTHVLLYGPPGTGKTTLARGLVHELGLEGLEVMGRDEGTPIRRRSALEACLHMSENRPNRVVLIDEADHLLNTESSWISSGDTADKAWLNDVLERPGQRCLWIANNTSEIEKAVQRRFDYSLEVPAPDQQARRAMLESVLRRKRIKRHFDQEHIREFARDFPVNPAVVAAAADTAKMSAGTAVECREVFRKSLEARVKLAGGGVPATKAHSAPFLREGINTSEPLDTLVELVRGYDQRWSTATAKDLLPSLNLLFHGAPGTGKSFTARHLAAVVDRPVLVRGASDLLDPYVGMTERNIAAAFAETQKTGAVLILDEIDALLHTRAADQKSWEISRVAEFLVQLETGSGLVVGTTNRLDAIDPAARRRFLERIEFGYLEPEQMVAMYRKVLGELAAGPLGETMKDRLGAIEKGTSAGFFAVRNRLELRMKNRATHAELVDELVREFRSGETERRMVGF